MEPGSVRRLPERGLLAEGTALTAAGLGAAAITWQILRRAPIVLAPVALLTAAAALLAAWGAAIALTGGVKHDDHALL